MDVSLIDMISNVGFPIAVVVYMFWRDREQTKAHKEETDGFVTAIENNTIALTKLMERMENGKED